MGVYQTVYSHNTGEMGQHDKEMERQQIIGSIGQTISY